MVRSINDEPNDKNQSNSNLSKEDITKFWMQLFFAQLLHHLAQQNSSSHNSLGFVLNLHKSL
jgi:hypothetical protein